MANFIVSTNVLTFTATSSTAATDHPASNLALPKCPFRTWRSVGTGTEHIVLNLGAEYTVGAVMLHHGNFTQFDLYTAPASESYTIRADDYSFSKDTDVNRRKYWLTLGTAAVKYIKIDPGSIVAGETYWELGSVVVFGTTVTLGDNPSAPRRIGHRQAHTRVEFAGGGFEINEDGEPYLEYWLESPYWDKRSTATIRGQLFDLLNAGIAAPIGLYENQSDVTKCYLLGRLENPDFNEQYSTFETGIALREYV